MVERGGGVVINLASSSGAMDPPAPAGQGGWGLGYGMSKAALHRLAGMLAVELGDRGIRAYNLSPGFIATERIAIDMGDFGFDASAGAPVDVVGAVAAWLVTVARGRAPQRRLGRGARRVPGARPSAGVALSPGHAPLLSPRWPMRRPRATCCSTPRPGSSPSGASTTSRSHEIVRAAHQRNASAVHYHFGSRDEILRSVLARHVPAIADRRHELLERARARPDGDVRSAAEAVVRPVTEFAQRGWRERAYLQIGSELTGALDRTSPEIRELLMQTAGDAAWDLFGSTLPDGPARAVAGPPGGLHRLHRTGRRGPGPAARQRGCARRLVERRPLRRQPRRHGHRRHDGTASRRLTS